MWNSLPARVAALAALVLALALPPTAAQAGVADKLWDTVKSELAGQIPHDQMEMANYAIAEPFNGATVFARAAAQDYPFFALVGAVKAAKGKSFPKIGVFTEEKCKAPLTFLDTVADKAAGTISDAGGKANTNAMLSQAKQQVAQAATDQAKQQVVEQLTANIPYFGDLPVICNFAFNTNFQAETDIQSVAGGTAKTVYNAYLDFQGGDVSGGVALLVGLGINASIACDIVDQAVSGGLIGKTPVLGTLANGVCKGFVGKVFNGVGGLVEGAAGATYGALKSALNTGEKVAGAVGCAIESIFTSGCGDDDPPPPPEPTAEEQAAAAHAKVLADDQAYYVTNLPLLTAHINNAWLVRCHSDPCSAKVVSIRQNAVAQAQQASVTDTGNLPAQMLQIFAAANAEAELTVVDFSVEDGMTPVLAKFDAAWPGQCDDDICRTGVRFVRLNLILAIEQTHAAYPKLPFGLMFTPIQLADSQASDLVDQSKARTAAYAKMTTIQTANAWQALLTAFWGKKCSDALCVQQVAATATAMRWETYALQANQPDASSLNIQGQVGPKFGKQFKAVVDASTARAAAAVKAAEDVNTAAKAAAAKARAKYLAQAIKDAHDRRAAWIKTHRRPGARPAAKPAPKPTAPLAAPTKLPAGKPHG